MDTDAALQRCVAIVIRRRLRCRMCLFCQSCSSKHLRTVPRHFISMFCTRLALLHLICCLLLLHASSRTIKQIDVPALFKRHSADAELGNALRELKSRILRQGDSEDHLEFAVQLYKLGRATDALSEFRQVGSFCFPLWTNVSSTLQRGSSAQSRGCACAALAR